MLTRDQQLLSRLPVTQPLRYQQSSTLARPLSRGDAAASSSATSRTISSCPTASGRNNPKTVEFARELRSKHPTTRRYIDAVLDWFHRESFFYTLAPPLLGANPVDEFLFGTRRGFCEHYASAFVVMLRAAGIPARVVTGYQGGTINPSGDYMIVRQSDAHAWAEALVGGQWRRFDPTAAVAPSRIQLGLGGSLPAGEPIPLLARLDDTFLKSLQLSWDAINHDWRRNVIGFNFDRQRALWREWKLNVLAPWQITAHRRGAGGGLDRRVARLARVARAAGRTVPARCGIASARASLAPACRAPRTKDRSTTSRAPRRAGRSSRKRSPSSATRTRSCATGRSRRTPTRRSSAHRRSGACAARCASCPRALPTLRRSPAASA